MNPHPNSLNIDSRQSLPGLSADDVDFMTRFPVKFIDGNFADYIWGGYHLYDIKGLPYDKDARLAAESWEVSGHRKYPSRILMPDGRAFVFMDLLKDRQLAALIMGDDVVNYFGQDFPILVKFVDVHRHMSVHLHPSPEAAKCLGEKDPGKEEVFIVLDIFGGAQTCPQEARKEYAAPSINPNLSRRTDLHESAESALYLGLKEGVSREDFEAAVRKNENLLNLSHKIYVRPGDIFRIPSGVLHCWTGGSIAVEITESSDLTYRMYDFKRQRPMHIEKGFTAIDYNCKQGVTLEKECRGLWQPASIRGVDSVLTHNALKVERLTAGLNGNPVRVRSRDTFEVLMGIEGAIEIMSLSNDWLLRLNKGSSLLIPAKAGDYLARGLDETHKNRALRISMKMKIPAGGDK